MRREFTRQNFQWKISGGFTLLEIVLVIVIMTILATIGLSSLGVFRAGKTVEVAGEKVISMLKEAQSLTLASQDASQYGVHFEETKAVLFVGGTYSGSDPDNVEYVFQNQVIISDINLDSGDSEVLFERLSGETVDFGTTTVSRSDGSGNSLYIVIRPTGIIESTY